MADIRCPMCGRPNPEELDECIFCQARLRPLVASDSPIPAEGTSENPPEPPAESEPPDWLAKIRDQKPLGESSTSPFSGLGQDDLGSSEVPDWLRSVRERSQKDGLLKEPPLGIPNLGIEPGSAEVDDEWLQSLRDAKDQADAVPVPGDNTAPLDQMPDWLVDISEVKTSSNEAEPSPDWLNGLRGLEANPSPEPAQGEPEPSQVTPAEENHDWMRDLRGTAILEPEPEVELPSPPPTPAEPPVIPIPLAQPPVQKSEPSPPAPAPQSVKSEPTPQPEAELPPAEPQGPQWEPGWSPDWLSKIEAKAEQPTESPTSAPENDATLESPAPIGAPSFESPDWLSQLGSARSSRAFPEEKESPGDVEGVTPAELPTWVQEMRPVETVAPQPSSIRAKVERVEERGPLAGLKNVLPSEPTTTEIHRPPAYIPRLQVNDRHQAHSELLSQLIASENEPIPALGRSAISSQRILRLVIAVLLFFAVLYPILSGSALFPAPTAVPQEVSSAYETVDSLGSNEAVLVVVDYEAAFTGEMEAAGSAVLDHVMEKGARIALISTNPVGQALSERLDENVYSRPEVYMAPYKSGERLVNLGYLPGGTAGLAGFAANPQSATYFDIFGQPAWSQPALQGITTISDFSEILVFTENIDTARAWFEQVGTQIPSSLSMVLVTSAQAAPILRAYLDSGQAQGMVAGLTGGTAYGYLRGRLTTSRSFWDAYQAGIWAAVLLILIGSLMSVLWPMIQRALPQYFSGSGKARESSTVVKKEPSL